MGIKHLNRLIRNTCNNSLKKLHFSELKNKKLAIDISIYLYKYQLENTLIENIYLMISLFRMYNIIPVFIFDGKPPAEKKELLKERRDKKKEAKERYDQLQDMLSQDLTKEEKQNIIDEMDNEKKNFVKIRHSDIENVKKLIRLYGVTYYDAPGEAEELCALLLKKNIVDGCISEDMDLFLYGCEKVYRYLSLANSTVVLYNTNDIFKSLRCSLKEFQIICILSGTDYYNFDIGNLSKCMHLFNKFLKSRFKIQDEKQDEKQQSDFFNWLQNNKILTLDDYDIINNIIELFNYSNIISKNKLNNTFSCKNINYNNDSLKCFMKDYGFIYLN
jgi:flap endonuclease-1